MPIRYFSILLWSTSLWAQFSGRAVVRGELQTDALDAGQDYQVELLDCSGGSPAIRAPLFGANRFEFTDVSPGCKTLRVVSGPERAIVHEVQIQAESSGAPLMIRLAERDAAPEAVPVKAATVSAARLRHPLPEKAARAIADADRLWRAGRLAEAGEKLRPTVAKYPDFWELHMSLGKVEAKLRNYAAAAEQFSRTRELEPRAPLAALFAGFALFELHRWEEAENAARDAVALEPANPLARGLLAQIQATRRLIGTRLPEAKRQAAN